MLVCSTSLKENYYALVVAILTKATPERAFELLESGGPVFPKHKNRTDLTDEDTRDMIKMKKTMTYKQIGEIYGMSDTSVYKRIVRFKNNQKKAI